MLSKRYIGGILALLIAYYFSNRNCCSSTKKEGKTVDTKSGSVKGIISLSRDGREFYEWLGIPYAKPPVGPLRFATPQALDKKWDGVRETTAYGSSCAQVSLFSGKIEGNEDCLFLNVHVPKIEGSQKPLPVMVWIHGGYFVCGASQEYKPLYFMDEDVLIVTINYRLAALGFLNTGDAASRGNMGLKDQSLALKWVKENIASFGGDPNQITIFGESAGGGSVHYQMLSPMSQGLVHRAISQSGSAYNSWALYEDPVGQAKTFAGKLNCPTGSTTEMVKCLRNVDINDLLAVHLETVNPARTKDLIFVPTIEAVNDEETFLPAHPKILYKSGKVPKVPWLTGFNADEGLLFVASIRNTPEYRTKLETDLNFIADVGLHLSDSQKKHTKEILNFYYGRSENLNVLEQFKPTVQLLTDRWWGHGVEKSALEHAKIAPVQLYYYNKAGPSLYDLLVMIEGKYPAIVEILCGVTKKWFNSVVLRQKPIHYGVAHADDVAMLFEALNFFKVPKGDPHYEFSKDMVKTWVAYASTKNVEDTAFRGVKLPLLSPKGDSIVIEINDVPGVKQLPSAERLKFWESVGI